MPASVVIRSEVELVVGVRDPHHLGQVARLEAGLEPEALGEAREVGGKLGRGVRGRRGDASAGSVG